MNEIMKELIEHGSSKEGREHLVKIIEAVMDAAWKEGRDEAAAICDEQSGLSDNPLYLAKLIRALKSPYEVEE